MAFGVWRSGDVTLYRGDCLEVMLTLKLGSIDMVMTDPPYSEKTHKGMRSLQIDGHAVSTIDFAAVDADFLRKAFEQCARICDRWVVSFIDWCHAASLQDCPPIGLDFIRLGIWVKRNGMRQLTADRPAMGWEAIAFLHKTSEKLHWHGRGRHAVFDYLTVRAGRFTANFHPAEKPVELVSEIIRLFTDRDDIVFDPFMGSGTTGVACVRSGRRFIGIEIGEDYFEIAKRRIQEAQSQPRLDMPERSDVRQSNLV